MSKFTATQIATVYEVIAARRDMRHFRSEPLDDALLTRLLEAAHCAPSVGYVQPWRFIRVRSVEVRAQMLTLIETERMETARALGEREQEFLRLKVGRVDEFYPRPMLETQQWRARADLSSLVFEDHWRADADAHFE